MSLDLPTPPAWVADGLCAQTDPELFFSSGKGSSAATAKRICATCPVLDACREYAIALPDLEGIWGGTTERQRARARVARRKATGDAAPTPRRALAECGTEAAARRHRRRSEPLDAACLTAECRARNDRSAAARLDRERAA